MSQTNETPRVLVIRGSEWQRGQGVGSLFDGQRFCLVGLDLRDRGVAPDTMLGVLTPSDIRHSLPAGHWARGTDGLAGEVAIANDWRDATDEERIEAARPLLARVGVALDFRPNE